MQVLQFQKKGLHRNAVERFYIHKEAASMNIQKPPPPLYPCSNHYSHHSSLNTLLSLLPNTVLHTLYFVYTETNHAPSPSFLHY